MRNRKAFLSWSVVAAAGLLVAPTTMATNYPPCTSSLWTVAVKSGPCTVSNPATPACSTEGAWTGIEYEVSGASAEHVATLVTRNNDVSTATGNIVNPACRGDLNYTYLGYFSCHEKAVKVPLVPSRRFWVVVDGNKKTIETSVAVKKGTCTQAYAVPGLGLASDANPFRAVTRTETITFKGCSVVFEYDPVTNDVLSAELADDSSDCDFFEATVDKLNVTLDVEGAGALGLGKFGEGYISTGSESCTTRVVGGRVYTWGKPCP